MAGLSPKRMSRKLVAGITYPHDAVTSNFMSATTLMAWRGFLTVVFLAVLILAMVRWFSKGNSIYDLQFVRTALHFTSRDAKLRASANHRLIRHRHRCRQMRIISAISLHVHASQPFRPYVLSRDEHVPRLPVHARRGSAARHGRVQCDRDDSLVTLHVQLHQPPDCRRRLLAVPERELYQVDEHGGPVRVGVHARRHARDCATRNLVRPDAHELDRDRARPDPPGSLHVLGDHLPRYW